MHDWYGTKSPADPVQSFDSLIDSIKIWKIIKKTNVIWC